MPSRLATLEHVKLGGYALLPPDQNKRRPWCPNFDPETSIIKEPRRDFFFCVFVHYSNKILYQAFF